MCYIYVYHYFWKMHSCSWHSAHHIAKVSMDADLDAIAHGWAFGIVGVCKKQLGRVLRTTRIGQRSWYT